MASTLYDLLGCDRSCTTDQLLAEYRIRVVRAHPDKFAEEHKAAAETRFHELQQAKEILCDNEKRKCYDMYLSMGTPFGITLDEWMHNQEKIQQTLHWAQPTKTVQELHNVPEAPSSCKSAHSVTNYPRRFNSWVSHSSPVIKAFRNYQI